MSSNRLNTPSEYFIDSIIIKSDINDKNIDIVNLFTSISIYEGITYNFMYGNIVLKDTNGFIESNPIIGEEKISFRIKKKMGSEEYFEVKGQVYSITNREKEKGSNSIEIYQINFITDLAMKNQTQRVSKTYTGTVSSMVEKISSEYLNLKKVDKIEEKNPKLYETILIEKTMDENKLNIPNLNPIESINFLNKFSYSQNQNDKNPFNTTFFFYQTRQGFFFQSIENLITKQKDKKRYEFNISKNTSIRNEPNERINVDDLFTVSDFKILNLYDNFESVNSGYYGGTNIGYDTLTKSFHKYDFNYDKNFDNIVNLEKYNTNSPDFIFNKNPEKTNIFTLPTKAGSDKSEYISQKTKKDIFYDKREKINLLKYIKKSRFNNGLVIEITIPSHPKIYVNDIINLKFPSFMRDSNGKKMMLDDKYFSGDYIIIAISHRLTDPTNKFWEMSLTLLKDSYKKEIK